MVSASSKILDLTRDLAAAVDLGASEEQVDQLLGESLDTLGKLVPFDLATIMELQGEGLRIRVARGELAGPAVAEHRLDLSKFPALADLLRAGDARAFTDDDHQQGDAFDGILDLPEGHWCMVAPLRVHADALGIMTFDRKVCGRYPEEVVRLVDVFARLLAVAMSYGEQSTRLHRLHQQLQEQNRLLSERVSGRNDAASLMAASRSQTMTQVVSLARQVAATDTPVLITGETGTGKEVMANAIHSWSHRAGKPLVSVNCAALPAGLIESELFGHVKGAFSGATAARIGRFQAANGGTLLLDEVGELPADLQAKLLRALQEGCFEPVGSDRTIRVDVRIIAATNTDLQAAVAEKRFREDLFYRLAVFPLHLPPLRARREDIEVIAEGFLASLARRTGRGPWRLNRGSIHWLEQQPWPGNVRELVNTLERATILSGGELLELDGGKDPTTPAPVPPPSPTPATTEIVTLEEMERQHISRALNHTGGKLYGDGGAAELLGINPNTLRSRMKKLGLGGARSFK
jgi:transcriptional regulator with GAF, ATPase, and Fis domain